LDFVRTLRPTAIQPAQRLPQALAARLTARPIFTNIFAEDTIAASAYNSFQMPCWRSASRMDCSFRPRTLSASRWTGPPALKRPSIPFNYKASRALSLFNSAQRFVINYVLGSAQFASTAGFAGKVLDDWELSGILQFQSGFPIRLQTQDDFELISSLFFLGTGAPQLSGPLQILNPKTTYVTAASISIPPSSPIRRSGSSQRPRVPSAAGRARTSGISRFHKKIASVEAKYFQFRADIFNLFNKTQFVNPDGNFSDSTFGIDQQARDPRLVQFALKFYF
jgi:hypothetical protein